MWVMISFCSNLLDVSWRLTLSVVISLYAECSGRNDFCFHVWSIEETQNNRWFWPWQLIFSWVDHRINCRSHCWYFCEYISPPTCIFFYELFLKNLRCNRLSLVVWVVFFTIFFSRFFVLFFSSFSCLNDRYTQHFLFPVGISQNAMRFTLTSPSFLSCPSSFFEMSRASFEWDTHLSLLGLERYHWRSVSVFFHLWRLLLCSLNFIFSLRHSHPWISFTSQCVIDVTFSWQTYFTLRLYYFFFLSSHPSAVSSLSSVFRHYSCSSFNTIRGWQRILMESWFSFLHTQF